MNLRRLLAFFLLCCWVSTTIAASSYNSKATYYNDDDDDDDDGSYDDDDDDGNKCDEFSYDEDSEFGPSKWGEVCKDWATCSDGENQSPIDIVTADVVNEEGELNQRYAKKFDTTVVHEEALYNFYAYLNEKEKFEADGLKGTYRLTSISYHTPAEHTVDGKRYPLELQLTHKAVKDEEKVAILSVFYKYDDEITSKVLKKLEKAIKENIEEEEDVDLLFPLREEIFADDPADLPYYSYMGSLTVPPCDEDVMWLILTKPLYATKQQIKNLKKLVGNPEGDGNARPIQDLNDREVIKYELEEEEEEDDDDSYVPATTTKKPTTTTCAPSAYAYNRYNY